MKILSVDDKAENLYMLEALLRGHGHEVDSASNGVDALRLAERGHYDVIISDILMPRMDGFQLCREVKRDTRLSRVPFIFYTATYTDPRDASFALSLGADRFLVKPIEPEVFIRTIDEVCTGGRIAERPAVEPDEDESVYLKEYNARLIAKLEKKMLDVEQANRALEAELEQRDRAESERARSDRERPVGEIGVLAGGIAHELNNVLAGITGFAELIDQDAGDAAAVKRHVRDLFGAAGRGRLLVRQILAYADQPEPAPEPPAEGAAEQGSVRGRGQRILFIDDENILVSLGERFLTRLGYEAVIETDPVAALERFTRGAFAAVVTDLTMPQLSGLDVVRRLHEIEPELPVLLATGFSANLDIDRARALGFCELLVKPYTMQALGTALRRSLPGA